METLELFVTKFNSETLLLSALLLCLTGIGIFAYWSYNRKRFHELSHQVPAGVLKNYLDSIIANSTALKSSLFRGGGLEMGGGIPSVVPVDTLPGSSGGGDVDLSQKNAEIASLHQSVREKEMTIIELEDKVERLKSAGGGAGEDQSEEVAALQAEVKDLKAKLEAALASSGGDAAADPEAAAKLEQVTKERDELKERLMEYEIIEEDLANLKRLQQENEELRKEVEALKGAGGAAPAAEAAPPAEEAAPPAEEPTPAEEPAAEAAAPAEETAPAQEAAPAAEGEGGEEVPSNEGEQKSAEELLSEFEKMLG